MAIFNKNDSLYDKGMVFAEKPDEKSVNDLVNALKPLFAKAKKCTCEGINSHCSDCPPKATEEDIRDVQKRLESVANDPLLDYIPGKVLELTNEIELLDDEIVDSWGTPKCIISGCDDNCKRCTVPTPINCVICDDTLETVDSRHLYACEDCSQQFLVCSACDNKPEKLDCPNCLSKEMDKYCAEQKSKRWLSITATVKECEYCRQSSKEYVVLECDIAHVDDRPLVVCQDCFDERNGWIECPRCLDEENFPLFMEVFPDKFQGISIDVSPQSGNDYWGTTEFQFEIPANYTWTTTAPSDKTFYIAPTPPSSTYNFQGYNVPLTNWDGSKYDGAPYNPNNVTYTQPGFYSCPHTVAPWQIPGNETVPTSFTQSKYCIPENEIKIFEAIAKAANEREEIEKTWVAKEACNFPLKDWFQGVTVDDDDWDSVEKMRLEPMDNVLKNYEIIVDPVDQMFITKPARRLSDYLD